MQMRSKNYVVITVGSQSGLRYKNRVRSTSESYVRLTLGRNVIKPCNWNQKVTWQLRLEATSELHYKSLVRITSRSYVSFTLGDYVIKPCKWEQNNT